MLRTSIKYHIYFDKKTIPCSSRIWYNLTEPWNRLHTKIERVVALKKRTLILIQKRNTCLSKVSSRTCLRCITCKSKQNLATLHSITWILLSKTLRKKMQQPCNSLLVFLTAQPSQFVSNHYIQLSSTLNNLLSFPGGYIVCYLCAVFPGKVWIKIAC